MTITPVSTTPVPSAGGSSAAGSGLPGEFAALVRQHLDDAAGQESALAGEEAAALLQGAATPVLGAPEGLAAMLAGVLGAGSVGTTDAPDALGGSGASSGGADALPLLGGGPTTGRLGPLPGMSLADAAVAAGPFRTGPGAADLSAVPGAGDGAEGLAAAAPAEGAVDPKLLEGLQAVAQPSAADHAGASATGAGAGLTAPTAAGAATSAGPATDVAARSSAVTDQVFPQVARLVSRGDGLHRLTLRLHPADLGEVKVVLTVKDNVVDVTLTAGAAARDALREGSPQLRALLELAGATTGQLVVRELTATGSTLASTGQQAGGGPGQAGSEAAGDGAGAESRTGDGAGDGRSGTRTGRGGTTADGHDPTLDPPPTGRQTQSQLDLDL